MNDIEFLADMCGDNCNWFLVGLRSGKIVAFDGCWATLEDVRKARYLREQLQPGDNSSKWYAVRIMPVEPLEYDVNWEAINTLNDLKPML